MTLKHAKTSGAGASPDPAKVGGDDWNADHVVDAAGVSFTATTSNPAAPAAGKLQLYARQTAAQPLPAFVAPNGQQALLQTFLGRKAVTLWLPRYNSATVDVWGNALSISNSTVLRTPSTATSAASLPALVMRRVGATSSTTAGSTARFSGLTFAYFRGNFVNCGGFTFWARWSCTDAPAVAGARSFAGLTSNLFNNVNPSTQLNLIGVGSDGGDTTLSLFTNDGTGTATKIALGASFPDHTVAGSDVYELVMYCPPNASFVNVELTRVNTGDVFRTTQTTDLPDPMSTLNICIQRSNAATAQSVTVDLMALYVEAEV